MKSGNKVKWIYLIILIILIILSAIIFGINSYINEEETNTTKFTFMTQDYTSLRVRQEPYIIGLQIGLYIVLSIFRIILVLSVNIKNNKYKSIYAIIFIILGSILLKNPPIFPEILKYESPIAQSVDSGFEGIIARIYSIIIIIEGIIILIASNLLAAKNRRKIMKEE